MGPTSKTTATLKGLFNEAHSAIIGELETSGYTVDQASRLDDETEYGWLHKYRVNPGSDATLLLAANIHEDGDMVIRLEGDDRFGKPGGYINRECDQALWDKLDALRQRLAANHALIATLDDPDYNTGAPGSPGTYIPDERPIP
jgi:hypothetical protein